MAAWQMHKSRDELFGDGYSSALSVPACMLGTPRQVAASCPQSLSPATSLPRLPLPAGYQNLLQVE